MFDPPRRIKSPPEPPDVAGGPGVPTLADFLRGPKGVQRMTRLYWYALWKTRVQQDAQDRLQDALTGIRSGDRTWDGAKTAREQYIFIMQVIDSLVSHEKTGARPRHEQLSSDEHGRLPDVVDTQEPTPLEVLDAVEDHEAEKKWVADVRVLADEDSQKIIDASQREIEDVAGQIADTGMDEKRVLNARKRLRYTLEHALPKGLRERAKAAIDRIRGTEQRPAGKDKAESNDGPSAAPPRHGQKKDDTTSGDEGGAS